MRRYTVAALSAELDRLMNRAFPRIAVEGELSQISTPASGHAYLTLRDEDNTLSCVMWRSDWQQLKQPPVQGQRVVCFGRVGIYASQGKYQLYVKRLEAAGEGALERRLAAIRQRLDEDGLLDPRRKRPLPPAPTVVGLATSLTGAALQDFLRVSRGRWPAARILVSGCKVQGPDAAASVVRALEVLYRDPRVAVIVVTRGGGSRDDLGAFDDEQLARWIANAPVPVVSAVGHEVDTTIADLVADAVAPTPSAAALLVFPDGPALAQRVDEAALAMSGALRRILDPRRRRVVELQGRLKDPRRALAVLRARRDDLHERLFAAIARSQVRNEGRVTALEQQLSALSPFGVLSRGYAIVGGPGGIVRDPNQVRADDPLSVRVDGGTFRARVVE